ncbi:DUF418 domain-containing protein [Brevibacillus sp. RS1.1]|uniref:DUF418 domain-containing protein n=1 Tax=Brevibacillus sp. RS1.1 TaxID=2738982 RepID=UPI00156B51B6|nr:DUF418 domain-containing protein [Brevibacillus sp. RS1.1]NRR00740.1 DUF418 domain-containing protein [Brevibacillus sp. RS1.1]
MKVAPVAEGERIRQLDGIRGFALLGILLVNMPSFLFPIMFLPDAGMVNTHSEIDGWIRLLFNMFVQAKFYTIFSFLFGVGFFLFMHRAESKQLPYRSLFTRRLAVLLIFGLAHLVFLWYGDILHTYALAGFLLLLFYHRQEKTIKRWAWTLLIGMQTLSALILAVPENLGSMPDQSSLIQKAINTYTNGSIIERLQFRLGYEIPVVLPFEFFVILSVFPLFLFGFLAAKRGVFARTEEFIPAIRRVWWLALSLSVVLVPMIPLVQFGIVKFPASISVAVQTFVTWSGLSLCAFYITSLLLLYRKESGQRILKHLEPVGRMALSNYLSQTIIIILVVRVGHLYGTSGLALGLVLSLVIFSAQILASRWWLANYQFGPAEWLWRCLTYGKFVPMKRKGGLLSKTSS